MFNSSALRRAFALSLTLPGFIPARLAADSLAAGQSTAYTTVINFDRTDYYVDSRYSSSTPTAAMANLQTAILFDPLAPDASGNIALPANFADQVARIRAGSPTAGYTLGLGSLNAIAGNAAAQANFNTQLQSLVSTYGFTGIDMDWENMPGSVSASVYGSTVKAVSDAFRPAGIVISTSHASGSQYQPYVAAIAGSVDFVNLQFYYSTTNAMSLATFQSTLTSYLNQGLQASQLRIGLPSYGMVNPSVTSTTDKWRSWNNLIAAGVDVTNLNQWTDPSNGQTYYFSGLNLINAKLAYAKANGFAGVFTWELTQDTNYSGALSINRAIDTDALASAPVLELNDANAGAGKLGTGVVNLGAGAVLDNGVLRFARSGTNAYANRIDGYGAVEIFGTGTTVLTGANTHAGGTRIAAGSTLQVGSGGASGALGAGAVTNDGTLLFNHSDAATFANVITGAGTLTKTGTGKLTLTGTGNVVGSLGVTGGVLANTGDLLVSGNALIGVAAAGTFEQTAGTVTVASATGGFGAGLNIGHKVGGVGAYNLSGGTLNVTGANTTIGAGGGNTGTLAISGSGTANLRGLDLTTSTSAIANLNLSGGRINFGAGGINAVSAGTRNLSLGAGTVGAFADWATSEKLTLTDSAAGVTFDTLDSDDGATARTITLAGVLSGAGKLNKTGAGSLVLAGANTHTGGTEVFGGVLVTGHAGALGAGSVGVGSGATLVIGNGVANTVTLGPGASLVVGDGGVLKLGSTASAVTLTGAGGYDFSGTLDLNGLFDGVSGERSYTLITGGSGAKSDNLAGITGYDTSRVSAAFAAGMLTVTAVPEPSVYGLSGAAALFAGAMLRRRRRVAPEGKVCRAQSRVSGLS